MASNDNEDRIFSTKKITRRDERKKDCLDGSEHHQPNSLHMDATMMLLELITSLGCNFKNCNYSLIALFLRSHQEGKSNGARRGKKKNEEAEKGSPFEHHTKQYLDVMVLESMFF